MRMLVIAAAAMLAGCSATQPPTTARADPDVARELAGRVAGAPQRCVTIAPSTGMRIVGRSAFTYGEGGTIYLNTVAGGCGSFRRWDVLVTEPMGTQHCAGDLIRSFDPVSKIPGPTCRMGEFVPYRRPR